MTAPISKFDCNGRITFIEYTRLLEEATKAHAANVQTLPISRQGHRLLSDECHHTLTESARVAASTPSATFHVPSKPFSWAIDHLVHLNMEAVVPCALSKVQLALNVLPDNPLLLAAKAILLKGVDKTAEALKSIERAFELEPNNPFVKRCKAYLHLNSGHPGDKLKAVNEYLEATQDEPNSTISHSLLADSMIEYQLASTDSKEKTIFSVAINAILDKAMALNPRNPCMIKTLMKQTFLNTPELTSHQIYENLNCQMIKFLEYAHYSIRKFFGVDEDREFLSKKIENINLKLINDPLNPVLLNLRASLYVRRADLGDFQKAMKDVCNILKKDPKNATAHCTKAEIYIRQIGGGFGPIALETIETSLKIDPNNSRAQLIKAEILFLIVDNVQPTLKMVVNILREDPSNRNARMFELGILLTRMPINTNLLRLSIKSFLFVEPNNKYAEYAKKYL